MCVVWVWRADRRQAARRLSGGSMRRVESVPQQQAHRGPAQVAPIPNFGVTQRNRPRDVKRHGFETPGESGLWMPPYVICGLQCEFLSHKNPPLMSFPISRLLAIGGDRWVARPSLHGFVDFNHVHRPRTRGAGSHYSGKVSEAVAQR